MCKAEWGGNHVCWWSGLYFCFICCLDEASCTGCYWWLGDARCCIQVVPFVEVLTICYSLGLVSLVVYGLGSQCSHSKGRGVDFSVKMLFILVLWSPAVSEVLMRPGRHSGEPSNITALLVSSLPAQLALGPQSVCQGSGTLLKTSFLMLFVQLESLSRKGICPRHLWNPWGFIHPFFQQNIKFLIMGHHSRLHWDALYFFYET